MRSVFLLLGEKRKDIDTWMKIKVMIGKTGKESLKRRITEFVPSSLKQLPPVSIDYVQKYLAEPKATEEMKKANEGTLSFFAWVKGIMEAESLSLQ